MPVTSVLACRRATEEELKEILRQGTQVERCIRAGDTAIGSGGHPEELVRVTLRDHKLLMEFPERRGGEGAEHAMAIHIRHPMALRPGQTGPFFPTHFWPFSRLTRRLGLR